MSRVLGVDYGERRIGVAVSDPTRTIAQPLPTLKRRRGKRPPYVALLDLITEWDVQLIVVGLPVQANGEEGVLSEAVRDFVDGLRRRSDVPVELWDERFTTARARRELARLDLPAKARRQKERVDAMAAMLILQSYLDAHSGS